MRDIVGFQKMQKCNLLISFGLHKSLSLFRETGKLKPKMVFPLINYHSRNKIHNKNNNKNINNKMNRNKNMNNNNKNYP
jgi:hypothetical protein